jgi:hypothetical protein
MSRGLGRLERLILQKSSERPVCLLCKNLATDAVTSRKAMARALHSFVRKFPNYALQGGLGRHHPLVLYDPADQVSERWASLSVKRRDPVTEEEVLQSFEQQRAIQAEKRYRIASPALGDNDHAKGDTKFQRRTAGCHSEISGPREVDRGNECLQRKLSGTLR